MTARFLPTAALLAATSLAAGDLRGQDTVTVRYVADLREVTNHRPVLEPSRAWRLSERPALEIRSPTGRNVWHPRRLSDGTIVFDEPISQEIHYHDASGGFVRAVGGKGSDPGRFEFMMGLWPLAGDTLLVHDYLTGSYSLLDADGSFVGRVRLEGVDRQVASTRVLGRGRDGSTLSVADRSEPIPAQTSVLSNRRAIVRHDATGAFVDSLARFPGVETYNFAEGRGRGVSFLRPFGREHKSAALPHGFVVAHDDRVEVQLFGPDGTLHTVARVPYEPVPVTREDLDRYVRGRPGPPDRVRRAVAAAPIPATHPPLGALLPDRAGNVWLQHFVRCLDLRGTTCYRTDGRARWSVLDPTGRWITDVSTPPDFQVEEIGSDYVLGLTWDERGRQSIALYTLIR